MTKYPAIFERFEIELTREQAERGAHPGPCDEDIADLLTDDGIKAQLDAIPAEDIRLELTEYGAWEDEELNDPAENKARILWIACGNVLDEIRERI